MTFLHSTVPDIDLLAVFAASRRDEARGGIIMPVPLPAGDISPTSLKVREFFPLFRAYIENRVANAEDPVLERNQIMSKLAELYNSMERNGDVVVKGTGESVLPELVGKPYEDFTRALDLVGSEGQDSALELAKQMERLRMQPAARIVNVGETHFLNDRVLLKDADGRKIPGASIEVEEFMFSLLAAGSGNNYIGVKGFDDLGQVISFSLPVAQFEKVVASCQNHFNQLRERKYIPSEMNAADVAGIYKKGVVEMWRSVIKGRGNVLQGERSLYPFFDTQTSSNDSTP